MNVGDAAKLVNAAKLVKLCGEKELNIGDREFTGSQRRLVLNGPEAFVGDLDRRFRAVDVKSGQTLWQARLGTSVQGFPVTFTAGGKQYVAVTTGLGGGSPRQVPRAIIPEVHHPNSGHAVYVFELPERR